MKSRKSFLVISVMVLVVGIGLFMMSGKNSQADEGKAVFTGADLACQGCGEKVEIALNNIIGIENFEINKKNNEVIVFYDPTIMKPEWIEKSLEASGFGDFRLE